MMRRGDQSLAEGTHCGNGAVLKRGQPKVGRGKSTCRKKGRKAIAMSEAGGLGRKKSVAGVYGVGSLRKDKEGQSPCAPERGSDGVSHLTRLRNDTTLEKKGGRKRGIRCTILNRRW